MKLTTSSTFIAVLLVIVGCTGRSDEFPESTADHCELTDSNNGTIDQIFDAHFGKTGDGFGARCYLIRFQGCIDRNLASLDAYFCAPEENILDTRPSNGWPIVLFSPPDGGGARYWGDYRHRDSVMGQWPYEPRSVDQDETKNKNRAFSKTVDLAMHGYVGVEIVFPGLGRSEPLLQHAQLAAGRNTQALYAAARMTRKLEAFLQEPGFVIDETQLVLMHTCAGHLAGVDLIDEYGAELDVQANVVYAYPPSHAVMGALATCDEVGDAPQGRSKDLSHSDPIPYCPYFAGEIGRSGALFYTFVEQEGWKTGLHKTDMFTAEGLAYLTQPTRVVLGDVDGTEDVFDDVPLAYNAWYHPLAENPFGTTQPDKQDMLSICDYLLEKEGWHPEELTRNNMTQWMFTRPVLDLFECSDIRCVLTNDFYNQHFVDHDPLVLVRQDSWIPTLSLRPGLDEWCLNPGEKECWLMPECRVTEYVKSLQQEKPQLVSWADNGWHDIQDHFEHNVPQPQEDTLYNWLCETLGLPQRTYCDY